MGQNLPTVSDLPNILETLQKYPFSALVLVALAYLAVQGIRAWRGGRQPDDPKKLP